MPLHAKPPKSTWSSEEKNQKKIESLQSYAIDDCRNEDEKKTAGKVTGLTFFSFSVLFCLLENLDWVWNEGKWTFFPREDSILCLSNFTYCSIKKDALPYCHAKNSILFNYEMDNRSRNPEPLLYLWQILKAMGLAKTATAAVNLLIDIGYFPVHVNLDLLKFNIRTDYAEEILAAAESLLSESPDLDQVCLFHNLK